MDWIYAIGVVGIAALILGAAGIGGYGSGYEEGFREGYIAGADYERPRRLPDPPKEER